MARRPLGKPVRANRPCSSVMVNFPPASAAIITPAMGRPLKEEMTAPWIPAVVSV